MSHAGSRLSGDSDSNEGSLAWQAYQVLRRALRDGLIQGGRYYSESEFADMLGVSRTPVREALKALERQGVLQTSRNRGYRLRSFSSQELAELVELRRALERIAVTALIRTGGDSEMDVLAEILERQNHDRQGAEIFALDEEFHLTIAELAGLTRTRDILSGLRSAVAAVSAGASVPLDETRRRVQEHHAIYDAIAAGDVKTATRLMDRHIAEANRTLLVALGSERTIKPLRSRSASAEHEI